MSKTESTECRPRISVKMVAGKGNSPDDPFHCRQTIKRFIGKENAGCWVRNCVEDVSTNWVIECARRHPAILQRESNHCLILCGGGYDILLLLNDAPLPKNVAQVPRVTVSACVATQRGEKGEFIEEDPIDEYGAMCPTDSMREQVLGEMTPIKDCRVYLDATASETYGSVLGGSMTNKRIVRCRLTDHWLLIKSKVERIKEKDAKIFDVEDEDSDWLDDPKDDEKVDSAEEAASGSAAAAAVADHEHEHEEKFGKTFNPKEFLLLEKAYKGEMKKADLKNTGKRFTKTDIKKAMQMARRVDKEEETDSGSDSESKEAKTQGAAAKANVSHAQADAEGVGTSKKREVEEHSVASKSKKPKTGDTAEEQPKKRGPGRPKGSKNKPKPAPKEAPPVKNDAHEKAHVSSSESTVTEQTNNTPKKAEAEQKYPLVVAKRGPGRPKGSKTKSKSDATVEASEKTKKRNSTEAKKATAAEKKANDDQSANAAEPLKESSVAKPVKPQAEKATAAETDAEKEYNALLANAKPVNASSVAKKAAAKTNADEKDAKKPAASDKKGQAKSIEAEGKTAKPANAPVVAEPSNDSVSSKSAEKRKKSSKKKKKSKKRSKHSSEPNGGSSSSKKHKPSDDEQDKRDASRVSPIFRGHHTRFT